MALNGKDAAQEITDPISVDAVTLDVAAADDDMEDIMFNIAEEDVANNSNEECVLQSNPLAETVQSCSVQNARGQPSEVEAVPSQQDHFDDTVDCDPMAALEELEQDAMCDCLMYSDSENSDDNIV
eukprot:TRINITY_DN25391_c0_g1_i1.p2 TRINITY_DN25391_c0_g1~~TRINITY_DN25391_c0_g1_i1.p2  ORF type:complete len:126 (-),score=41.20 TRINITY_DN25391_c0_g1_i1:40-417(-)